MFGKLVLVLAGTLALAACGNVVVDNENAAPSGGSSSGGSSGGAGECVTGGQTAAFGGAEGFATIGIAADASGVVWADDEGKVWTAGPGGAAPGVIASGLGDLVTNLALDQTGIYVVDYPTAIWRIDRTSGMAFSVSVDGASAVAVDADAMYVSSAGGVHRIDKNGGSPELIAEIAGAESIAVDGDAVFVRAHYAAKGAVFSVPKHGGAKPVAIVSEEPAAYHYSEQEIAVDDTHVYWVSSSEGQIMKAPKGGGAPVALASGVADPVSITVDGEFVYFTVRGTDDGPLEDRAVAKVRKTGGPIEYIAHGGAVSAFGIAVDDTRAYWTQKVIDGGVVSACK